MIYEKGDKVYCCCGQYIVPTKATQSKTIKCPRCGAKLEQPVDFPRVVIVKSS